MFEEVVVKREEFWSRVKTAAVSECWPWALGTDSDGYGEFQFRGSDGKKRIYRAHRVAYVLQFGELSPDVVLRHSCDRRDCCNPWHMLEGGHEDNVQDRVARNRSAIGTKNGRAKLTELEVTTIRHRLEGGESMSSIAKAFRVDRKVVTAIRDRRTWKHLT